MFSVSVVANANIKKEPLKSDSFFASTDKSLLDRYNGYELLATKACITVFAILHVAPDPS